MKNKIIKINKQLSEKTFDQYWLDSFLKEKNELRISFESISGGQYENETLVIKFEDVEYISLPRSFQTFDTIQLTDESANYREIFGGLGINYEEICDIKDSGEIYNKLISINLSVCSKYYVLCSDLMAWINIYPEQNKKEIIN